MTWESHRAEPDLFFERLGSLAKESRRWQDRRHRELAGTVLVVEAWRLPAARALIRRMGLERLVTLASES